MIYKQLYHTCPKCNKTNPCFNARAGVYEPNLKHDCVDCQYSWRE